MDLPTVREPAGVARLPHDARANPIPAHVGRPAGEPVKITAFDQRRLSLITAERRCTICAWKIRDDELCWYFTWPPAVEQNREAGWTLWDSSPMEGAGHEECMFYSAIVCPFLMEHDYQRRTVQRRGGEIITKKGKPRGDMILAGVPEVLLMATSAMQFAVVAGGGEAVLYPFDHGSDLRTHYEELMEGVQRAPDDGDLAFSALMTTPDDQADFDVLLQQLSIELVAELGGVRTGIVPRNERCPCGSGLKFKLCCLKRIEAVKARDVHARRRVIAP
jgi:hypothetical protein